MAPLPSEVRLPATLASLQPLLAFVLARAGEAGFGKARLGEIELVLEEVLVNVFKYAYPGVPGEVGVACAVEPDGRLRIEISDAGIPFDPLTREDPDRGEDLATRAVGGLGIFFVKQLIGDVRYRREGGKNILTLRAGALPRD
jgi:anti-sigma regulatory factor (Ser/Thr protein kinase)